MTNPFEIAKSDNLIEITFNESFHHAKNYQCLISAVLTLLHNRQNVTEFSLLINWREHFIQIPFEEKQCIQMLPLYRELGLTHLVNVTPAHPVVSWQLDMIAKNNPCISFFSTDSVAIGREWLTERGANTCTSLTELSTNWCLREKQLQCLLDKHRLCHLQNEDETHDLRIKASNIL